MILFFWFVLENKAVGVMKPGHTFTIEPMISQGDVATEVLIPVQNVLVRLLRSLGNKLNVRIFGYRALQISKLKHLGKIFRR